ncbi:hypothetical protein X760_28675 [Mesorhizobium sp. LSHC422A00]|nr:hypothetical protein X760_28675 [Mesorhizobium sp. LSHC422A00]
METAPKREFEALSAIQRARDADDCDITDFAVPLRPARPIDTQAHCLVTSPQGIP